MPGVNRYAELNLSNLRCINPQKTICLMAVSPIEVHGPHLPLGTDVFIAEKLQEEYCRALASRWPDFDLLLLPPVYAGCDSLPVEGSISVRAKTLEALMEDYVRSLAGQGFRYLIVCDNHGGPSHQLAMEAASRKAWRRYNFALINPFNVVYKKMVLHDKSFLELVGLPPGQCGDDDDCHAGTNETSLMLAARSHLVGDYHSVGASAPPAKTGLAALVRGLGKLLSRLGFKELYAEMDHLAGLLAWINAPGRQPYLGAPGLATPEAGERMIKGHVSVAVELVAEALAGKKPSTEPMLWRMRFFRR